MFADCCLLCFDPLNSDNPSLCRGTAFCVLMERHGPQIKELVGELLQANAKNLSQPLKSFFSLGTATSKVLLVKLEDGKAHDDVKVRKLASQSFNGQVHVQLHTVETPAPHIVSDPSWASQGFGCPI